jgi:hypothetical protein
VLGYLSHNCVCPPTVLNDPLRVKEDIVAYLSDLANSFRPGPSFDRSAEFGGEIGYQ